MNRQAILHQANGDDAYAVGPDRVSIRLRTARGDCRAVSLVWIDKYRDLFDYSDWHHDDYHDLPMERVASDDLFDYYEVDLDHRLLAMGYYFRLDGDAGAHCYGHQAFFREEDAQPWPRFTLAHPEPEDLFLVPDWAREAIVYQIFPDSFYRGDGAQDKGYFGDWHRTTGDGSHLGGTLQGILDKLPYLEDLGINVLYLTPIFESASNHRYNTCEYYKVDPILGTGETLLALVDQAHHRGMRVVLDVNVQGTGTGFFAFRDLMANGADSPYRDWYHVDSFPLRLSSPPNYRAWAYLHRMPRPNLGNPAVRDYFLDVLTHWISEADIDGWRLDTADEVSHDFWREARRRVKAAKADALLVGEVWYDGRPWLQGDQFDAVMNYTFRGALLDFFARDAMTPQRFSHALGRQRGQLRRQAWQAMWNLIGSHDTARFLSEAGGDVDRLKLALLFQMTYPGTPYLYYGDEVGMGHNDLAFRAGMFWHPERQNRELLDHNRRAIRLRRAHPALARGAFAETLVDDARGLYAFRRWDRAEAIDVLLNNSDAPQTVTMVDPAVDLLTGVQIEPGEISLAPRSGAILAH